jgi:hypothetical protein
MPGSMGRLRWYHHNGHVDGDVLLSWTDGSRMEGRKLHKSPRQEWGKSVSFRLSSYLNK